MPLFEILSLNAEAHGVNARLFNCGVSAAPYTRPDVGHWMSLIVKKQENICKDFTAFAQKVDAAKPAINGAFLIGHGTLRLTTMGDDLNRVATAPEIKQMRELLDQSLRQGAIGMSSGLFYAVSNAASVILNKMFSLPDTRLSSATNSSVTRVSARALIRCTVVISRSTSPAASMAPTPPGPIGAGRSAPMAA